ncbi:MAG: hypothetical protein DIZ77_14040 [endosymbiont of Seepiophila jonesi]|uniref:Uncharacterized protein n=1 Tax=endosymbiont of Lamellibrachia luymesi TaxID=2200907 RepID=A0A370DYW9_9GAMM|nr:MAG: hypothetical protein DIZ77_14040 [endosymbiont of Seepiophila jonesi]RDH91055.1 MAG: hypothetical protein DIZ79_07385 [endosymbiont of Lamellibrachia luymesi]
MLFEIDESVRKRAKNPHDIFMLNLAGIHLLAAPASFVFMGKPGLLIPLSVSLLIIVFFWIRASRVEKQDPWFVAAHWRLAASRTKILLVGYAITGAIIGLTTMATSGDSKGAIMADAFFRVAIVPALLTVMVCFVLESSGIFMAAKAELPNGLVKRFPPPDDVVVKADPTSL